MFFSIIIPLYNRPDEIKELLESLILQTKKNFEILIIEDGSVIKAEEIALSFRTSLDVKYFYKENSGQGFARNYGFERARGDYFIIFDSDCVIPPNYIETVEEYLSKNYVDAYGGPDKAHESFTAIQKAINYSMTSFFTTGGIRGAKKHLGMFHPRSFNMGISRKVYETIGGFIIPYSAEDLEFSVRIINSGFKTALIEDAFVYHKRRTDFKKFFKQLHFFGRARINLYRFYKNELKIIHFFPAIFVVYFFMCLLSLILWDWRALALMVPLACWTLAVFVDSFIQNKSVKIAVLSVVASYIQLTAYGIGFITDFIKRIIFRKK